MEKRHGLPNCDDGKDANAASASPKAARRVAFDEASIKRDRLDAAEAMMPEFARSLRQLHPPSRPPPPASDAPPPPTAPPPSIAAHKPTKSLGPFEEGPATIYQRWFGQFIAEIFVAFEF